MITDNAVYSDEVTIEAPVERVWDILLDFDNYSTWNTFCPTAKNKSLAMGSEVDMMVDLGDGPSQQVEYITRVVPNECIAWGMANKPEDPIHAVRSQHLKRLDDNRCTYVSVDEFGGPQMAAMMEHFAPAVETGFNRCAYDLKAYAEKTYKAST
ncbi:MAG: SRPBCC domain-containing protein [Halioglobus sp.]